MATPSPLANRATINAPASVERNAARLTRLRQKLERTDLAPARRASLEAEIGRLRSELEEQKKAIDAALADAPAG